MEEFLTSHAFGSDPRPKLLLVDDQPLNIRILHELFRKECDVYMATDGYQALEKAREILPDLILLDVIMPGMDGFEVCAQLKKDPLTADIAIIFITAYFDQDDEVKGFQLGGSDFIRKPINPVITRIRVENHLSLKKQRDLMRSIALTDGLTGVPNRRKFDEAFHIQWLQCTRDKEPLSLIMLDIDYFKRFNDRYGHVKGDECLRKVARTAKAVLKRPIDLFARYGGEEFVCLLPDTQLDGALHLAQMMVDIIRELNIENLDSDIDQVVTISAGVSSIVPSAIVEPEELIQAADAQLYKAKQNGRSQVQPVIESA